MTFSEIYLAGLSAMVGITTSLPRRVSAVSLLEKTPTTARPGYEETVGSISILVPWFPRKAGKG
jgi:hypothetical protein